MLLVVAAFGFDHSHAAFQRVLDAHFDAGRVDYRAIGASLDGYLAEAAAAEGAMPPPQAKAFWIDVYNALTIDLVAGSLPLSSIRDLDGGKVWDTRRFTVAGRSVTLNDIENTILRPLGDPRIHAALNCASLGCPPLAPKVYSANGLDSQLDAVARSWAATARFDGTTLTVSAIFDWYGDDFLAKFGAPDVPGLDGKAEAAANFVAAFDPERARALHAGGYKVAYAEYDWGLNQGPARK